MIRDEGGREGEDERRQHREDHVSDLDVERDGHPRGRAAPRHPVEGRADDGEQHRDDQRIDPDLTIDRIHRRDDDEGRRGAIAIKADAHDENGGAHHDPDGIFADDRKNLANERLEQTALGHHEEVEESEGQQHRRGRGIDDPGDHHVPQIRAEPTEQAEHRGDEDQPGDSRYPLGHH
jgi:hypothetical protein